MNYKKIFFILFLLSLYLFIVGSGTYWNTLNQNPFSIYDISSITVYPTVMLDDVGLKQEIVFDYSSDYVNFIGSIQGEYGRIGLFIYKSEDNYLQSYLQQFTNRIIDPIIIGTFAGKKIGKVNIAIGAKGFMVKDYTVDDLSVYDNINADFSQIQLNPSFSVQLPGNIIAEISPEIILRSGNYEDYIKTVESENNIGYSVNGRVIQNISGNNIQVFAHYSSQPCSYILTENDQTDNYFSKKDSLEIGLLLCLETFNYINSYVGINYVNTVLFDSLRYYNGSDSKNRQTVTIFPETNFGFDVFINRHISLQFGVKGQWINSIEELSPSLNPQKNETSFSWDYLLGTRLKYNNFIIDFGFGKNILSIPFILSGNTLADSEIRFGVSYNGFEY